MHKIEYTGNGNVVGKVQLPSSKSISNRLLALRNISGGNFEIENLSAARDTQILQEILSGPTLPETIDCQDAGTVFRFMLALCSIQTGKTFAITGTQRLLERPHDILIEALRELGALINWSEDRSRLIVHGKELTCKTLAIKGDVSSQFISALCMIGPTIKGGIRLEIAEPILSKPYISMTLDLMAQMGIQSVFEQNCIEIKEQAFSAIQSTYYVESDWSSACFFYALTMLSEKASIEIEGLFLKSIQGDAAMAAFFADFGILSIQKVNSLQLRKSETPAEIKARHFKLADYPDLAIPFIMACAIKYPRTSFSGLEHLRHKESDRIESLRLELKKIGIELQETNGHISFLAKAWPLLISEIQFDSHNDHRIAMSLALLSLSFKEINLNNIECIRKSFPTFFEQLQKLEFVKK